MALIRCILGFALSASIALGHPNYTGYSGAPGRGTCAGTCHGVPGGTVTVTGFPTSYSPDQTYLITIQRMSGSSIANFNGSCRVGVGTNNAGVLSAGTGTVTYNVSGETNGIHLSPNNQVSATFNWTAPAAGTGSVRLYVAAHQGSVDEPNTIIVQEATETVAPDAPQQLVVQRQSSDIHLVWNGVAGAGHYNVYRDSTEAVGIVPANLVGSTPDTTFVDSQIVDQPAARKFYSITTVVP